MKRILTLTCAAAASFALSSSAYATTCGPYAGVGVGKSWVKTPDSNIFVVPGGTSSHDLTGLGARAFGGFNVNKYIGLEGGYTRYARSSYTGSSPLNSASLRYYIHTYDVVLKGYLPIGYSGFNLYALGGYVRVVEIIHYKNTGLNTNGKIAMPGPGNTHGYNNRPIYGVGVNYNLGRHFTINGEVTQIERLASFGNSATAIPYLNLASLNVAYNFG